MKQVTIYRTDFGGKADSEGVEYFDYLASALGHPIDSGAGNIELKVECSTLVDFKTKMEKGIILPNGAMVIDCQRQPEERGIRSGYIILAFDKGNESCYVTWWCAADHLDCAFGHYFRDLHEACDDFHDRC